MRRCPKHGIPLAHVIGSPHFWRGGECGVCRHEQRKSETDRAIRRALGLHVMSVNKEAEQSAGRRAA